VLDICNFLTQVSRDAGTLLVVNKRTVWLRLLGAWVGRSEDRAWKLKPVYITAVVGDKPFRKVQ
jgi:hypothetical protein